MNLILEYFEALDRLKNNVPVNVPPNTKITKDSVALEAGRKKGSIKKSRKTFAKLIEAIAEASENQSNHKNMDIQKIKSLKNTVNHYRTLYEEASSREVMLIKRIFELESIISNEKKHLRLVDPERK